MRTKIESFTDLNAWREAHKLALMIYKMTKDFPKEELFALTSQIRRVVVSVTETQSQLLLARDLGYLPKEKFTEAANQSVIVSKLVNGLIKSCSHNS